MKIKFLYKTIFLIIGLVLLADSANAEKPTVIIQFNDPTSLCTEVDGTMGIYLEYGYKAISSSSPNGSLIVHSNTPWLKSGDSYGVTIAPDNAFDTFTEFYVSDKGNSCGVLEWVEGGTCDNNQITTSLHNGTLTIKATPVKVPLKYAGYGFQLNCEVVNYSSAQAN